VKLLAFDPGESTGWATFDVDSEPTARYELIDSGTADLEEVQIALGAVLAGVAPPPGLEADPELIDAFAGAEHIAFEDFVIYANKAQDLIGDYVRTARLIGAIQFIANAAGVPYTPALAREAKAPAEAAGAEELFSRPLHENRHANDAIRHGVWFVLNRRFRAAAQRRKEQAAAVA
jgi:hypothetical protein